VFRDALAPFVRSITVSRAPATPTFYPILPDLHPVLGFQFRGRLSVQRESGIERLATIGISGLQSGAKCFLPDAQTATVLVRCTPYGAYRLLGCSMDALANEHVALRDLAPHLRELEERLAESSADVAQELVRAWLAKQLERTRREVHRDTIAAAQRIERSGGREPIERVAGAVGVGRRQLERLFRTQIGIGPKELASIARFRWVLQRLDRRRSWADLAAAAGYADQPHFVRSFVRRTGMTPEQYAMSHSFNTTQPRP